MFSGAKKTDQVFLACPKTILPKYDFLFTYKITFVSVIENAQGTVPRSALNKV
jgi:hypothetical protein